MGAIPRVLWTSRRGLVRFRQERHKRTYPDAMNGNGMVRNMETIDKEELLFSYHMTAILPASVIVYPSSPFMYPIALSSRR